MDVTKNAIHMASSLTCMALLEADLNGCSTKRAIEVVLEQAISAVVLFERAMSAVVL